MAEQTPFTTKELLEITGVTEPKANRWGQSFLQVMFKYLPELVPGKLAAWVYIHWASKETYNFLEWCPLKSTASKWMIFGLMLATVLITHVKKQRNRMCQKWDKCLQITTSPISKSQNLLPFHRAENTSIAIHSNSIAGYVIMFTIRLLYSKPIVNGSRYWIWMNSYWNVR